MLAVARSDIGLTRQTNEDSYDCEIPNLYIIADGMGGHAAGEVASKLAIRSIKEFFKSNLSNQQDYRAFLKESILRANEDIFRMAQADKIYKGMGTTVSLILFDSKRYYWAHVGDSRIYLYRNRHLEQITKDHSLVHDLLEKGNISKAEADHHPLKNMLTRAVGVNDRLEVDTGKGESAEGDTILLTTDGVTNMVSDEDMSRLLSDSIKSLDDKADSLLATALEAGGEDNITLVLIHNEN